MVKITTKGIGTLEFVAEFEEHTEAVDFILCLSKLKNDIFHSYVDDFRIELERIRSFVEKTTNENKQLVIEFLNELKPKELTPEVPTSKPRRKPKSEPESPTLEDQCQTLCSNQETSNSTETN